MRISDLVKMGLKNLLRRKARTALTIVGVVIGSISIIVMVSIGMGMNASYEKEIMQRGSLTTITVSARDYIETEDDFQVKNQKLNDSFITQISAIEHVKAVTPYISSYCILESGNYMAYTQLIAFDTSTMADFEFPKIVKGQSPVDNKETFIYGANALNYFWPQKGMGNEKQMDPEKDRIKFQIENYQYNMAEGKKPFKVEIRDFGVLEAVDNYEYDQTVFVDIQYYEKLFKKFTKTLTQEGRKNALKSLKEYSQVKICVDNIRNVKKVQKEIEDMGYMTRSLQNEMEAIKDTSNMLQLVLGCIGGVSMLVSAISIANTMIMSIYERTKEIGVMKVLGCYVRDIKKLFLFESGMIGMLGGIIGIGLSYLGSWAINKYGGPVFSSIMQSDYMFNAETAKFSIIPLWLPVAALLFAIFIGVVSGYYPARRATRISAIEAMKTEG